MAKIDTTQIAGYESMTPEQKIAALEAAEIEDGAAELERVKNALSRANGEAAEWKRKHNALLSEDEQRKQAAQEELETLRKKVETMEKEKLIAGHTAQFLAIGYDESLANETALALVDGDMSKVFANQKKFLEKHDKEYKAKLMGGTPTPPAGGNGDSGAVTLDTLRKMPPEERLAFSQKHPDEYKKLYGGNE